MRTHHRMLVGMLAFALSRGIASASAARALAPARDSTPRHPAASASAAAVTDDRTTSLHDVARTAGSTDTTLTTANAPTLTRRWTLQTGAPVATSPTVAGGVAYFASWDGYEYVADAGTAKSRDLMRFVRLSHRAIG